MTAILRRWARAFALRGLLTLALAFVWSPPGLVLWLGDGGPTGATLYMALAGYHLVGGLIAGAVLPERWRLSGLVAWSSVAAFALFALNPPFDPVGAGEYLDWVAMGLPDVGLPVLGALVGGYLGRRAALAVGRALELEWPTVPDTSRWRSR